MKVSMQKWAVLAYIYNHRCPKLHYFLQKWAAVGHALPQIEDF
jgi:hypothetical protein